MKRLTIVLTVLPLLMASENLAAKIYKWVDKNGVTQFSTQPPLDQQKKEVETVKVHGGADRKNDNKDFTDHSWYLFEKGTKHVLILKNDSYSLRQETGSRNTLNRGSMKIDGKKLIVKYKHHKDKSKVGTKESFFIVQSDGTSLVLISDLSNKRYEYRRDNTYTKNAELSPAASMYVGKWKGVAGSDSIIFSGNNFIIRGKTRHGTGNHRYWARTERYKGLWNYDDPYLVLEIHTDKVSDKEDIPGRVGKQIRYQVLEKSDDRLVLLTPAKRKWILLRQRN